jgi:nucleoside phosphorylase
VGIGGGVPSEENDIRLGDVVVSKPTGQSGGVIQYDFGKTVQEGRFERTGSLNRPPDVLLTALANLQSKHMMEGDELAKHLSAMLRRYPRMAGQFARPDTQHDLLYDANYDHTMKYATCSQCDTGRLINREPRHLEDPLIHYGLIASGDQVMRHGATRERLREELDVLCFEMEAAGLMDDFPCLVVRGICDYADSHKNKRWQGYAAATAAAYAKELLSIIPGNLLASTRTAVETTKAIYQGSEFEEEEEGTTKIPKNSVSQINDQASGIVQFTPSQDLSNLLTIYMVASASADGTVRLWDSETGAARRTLKGHSNAVLGVAFSPDGRLVASASHDRTVRLWDSATGAARRTLKGHSDAVIGVAFSPDGRLVASASYDKTVRLWDSATGTARRTLKGHSDAVRGVAFSPDGRLVASVSHDRTVRLWDSATGTARHTLEGHSSPVYGVAFSPDGRLVASASWDC